MACFWSQFMVNSETLGRYNVTIIASMENLGSWGSPEDQGQKDVGSG